MKLILKSLCFLCLAVLVGCSSANSKHQVTDTKKLSDDEVKTVENAIAEAIKKSETSLSTYLKFDEFEPLLHLKDDKIRIINFWATWCKPCVAELPYFEKINSEYKDKNVEVMLVSLDDIKKLDNKVIPFVKERNLQSKVALLDDADYNSWIDKVSPEWSGSIPATLFYTKDKRLFFEQEFEYEELDKIVKDLL